MSNVKLSCSSLFLNLGMELSMNLRLETDMSNVSAFLELRGINLCAGSALQNRALSETPERQEEGTLRHCIICPNTRQYRFRMTINLQNKCIYLLQKMS